MAGRRCAAQAGGRLYCRRRGEPLRGGLPRRNRRWRAHGKAGPLLCRARRDGGVRRQDERPRRLPLHRGRTLPGLECGRRGRTVDLAAQAGGGDDVRWSAPPRQHRLTAGPRVLASGTSTSSSTPSATQATRASAFGRPSTARTASARRRPRTAGPPRASPAAWRNGHFSGSFPASMSAHASALWETSRSSRAPLTAPSAPFLPTSRRLTRTFPASSSIPRASGAPTCLSTSSGWASTSIACTISILPSFLSPAR